ncbi:MAG: hypothetical protein HY292_23425 [Planctomycetes bacterium]|nr:hypothetical protein [Planctomycetota bacterium]
MKLTSFVAVGVLAIAGTALAADTTKFVTNTGEVSVAIRIATPEIPGRQLGLRPGDFFDAIVRIENRSTERVELFAPTLDLRCAVNGVGYSWHVTYKSHAAMGPGAVVNEVIRLQVPVNADLGGRVKVGLVVGLATDMNDMRPIFAVANIAPGPTGPPRDRIEKTKTPR